jgi:hypothetical protein
LFLRRISCQHSTTVVINATKCDMPVYYQFTKFNVEYIIFYRIIGTLIKHYLTFAIFTQEATIQTEDHSPR